MEYTLHTIARKLKYNYKDLQSYVESNYESIGITYYEKVINVGSIKKKKLVTAICLSEVDNYKLEKHLIKKGKLKNKITGNIIDTYVYLGELRALGVPIGYKVGISSNPADRELALNKRWNAAKLDLTINMIYTSIALSRDNAYKLEKSIHTILHHNKCKLSLNSKIPIHGGSEFFTLDSRSLVAATLVCTEKYNAEIFK